MAMQSVSIVKYEKPFESVEKAVTLAGGFEALKTGDTVFIKPNIVFWTKAVTFPKWGVITTSRVIEDIIALLKDAGAGQITFGEGIITAPKNLETPAHAFETLGYNQLKKKYGINVVNAMARPFDKVDLGDGVTLRFGRDILESDYVVDLPVMKAHNQTVVSLGIKNLKGLIDIPSRKKCHSADPDKDLNFMIARLADKMPPIFCLADGIYTLERGPAFDGKMRRSNILVASNDVLSADLVGTNILGHDPTNVPHLVHAAKNHNRPLDLSDIEVVGETIESVASFHENNFAYTKSDDGEMPLPLAKQGLKGLFYRKYDLSLCTYCSGLNALILSAIRFAWKGTPWDQVEVLTGKMMEPTPGMKTYILVGQCMVQKHKDHPDKDKMIFLKGCPPDTDDVVDALHKAGIEADPNMFANVDQLPGLFMTRYQDQPDFDEMFFQIPAEI